MKFSVAWLSQWVEIDLEPTVLAERLTQGGLEVESVEPVATAFSGVVVGEIVSCQPHPDADKLSLCRVACGEGEPVQVVCGAPNARAGLKVPFAKVGAVLAGGQAIGKAKLRGVESHGMACSARELGLSEDHSGLLELAEDAPVGEDLRAHLGLDDHAIDLELTPNRADCFGMKGLARDIGAILGATYAPLAIEPVVPSGDDLLDIELAAPEDCPRYAGRIIRGVDPTAPSPLWLQERLRRSGIRSISAVVDCTNYVMMELGQPMHAFDLDTLVGGITVRRGRPGETLTLLDGKEVEVNEQLLAICDDSGPVALGGIMGGLATGVTDGTRNLLLESAWFRPATISGRARALGLHSDASHRFERGVDPQGQVEAMERITALLLDICGGQAGPVLLAESTRHLPRPEPVNLRLARLNRVLGCTFEAPEVERILGRLGMDVQTGEGGWQVTAPSARFDIAIEEDLIEEVARIHGYDRLPTTDPSGELSLRTISEHRVPLTRARETLCGAGYQETINYSFVDRRLLGVLGMDREVLALANPISSDMDVMRTALMPGLLRALERNLRRQQERVRLFETGTVFRQRDVLVEAERLGAVACGPALPEQWGADKRTVDFYDVKRDVENLLELRGSDGTAEFRPASRPWLHPGQAAEIHIKGDVAGWIGAVHPRVLQQLEIRPQVYAFEMDWAVFSEREVQNAKIISTFPSVRRDLAFQVPESVNYSEINKLVVQVAKELLIETGIFDQFSGHTVETGYKSVTIYLILQDVSCTLTDEVVDSLVGELVKKMESQLDAKLRG